MIYVENCCGDDVQVLCMDVGLSLFIFILVVGCVYLVGFLQEECDVVMKEMEVCVGDKWLKYKVGIEVVLECYDKYGFVILFGDWDCVVNSVGVLLKLQDGCIMVFNCGGLIYLVLEEMVMESLGL